MKCWQCQSSLSELDLQSGKCPACGAEIEESGADAADTGSQSVAGGQPPEPDQSPSAGDAAQDGDVTKTVSAGSLTVSEDDLEAGSASQVSSKSDTVSSDDAEPSSASRDVYKTIDARLQVQTVSDLDDVNDSVDSSEAVEPRRPNSTIDSTAGPPGFAELPPDADQDPGTVNERTVSKTVNTPLGDEVIDDLGTMDDRGFRTLDSVAASMSGPAKARLPDDGGTFDSQAMSAEDQQALLRIWGAAAAENTSPRMTIKGDEPAGKEPSQATLVIQSRAFSQSEGQPPDEASADYDLVNKLGEGGMGVVYMARQASIDRTVAVKMLKPRAAVDRAQKTKFLAEAVITGDLEHPNIVPIYDLGKNDSGALFYAMKRVKGTPWDEVIKQQSQIENLEILMKICDAVAFAHSRGIIHRDLKPENTMLGDFGEVLVMDWGLALQFGEQEKSRAISQKPGMGGTPAYMAPEMATGPFHDLGPASDIYLLGAILFEIVVGRPPHRGKDVMRCLLAAARNEIVSTHRRGELLDIAHRAMSTDTAARYASVTDFQHALRGYQEHADSISMASRAREELVEAQESDDYETYAKALFGFQEALNLWSGNKRAEQGVSAAKLAYARSAYGKGDLDLGASLLDPDNESHHALKEEIANASRERDARQRRLKLALRAVAALVATVLVVVTAALVVVHEQKTIAEGQRELARTNAAEARRQEAEARRQGEEARRQEQIAVTQRKAADRLREEADKQRVRAVENAQEARRQQLAATQNAKEAERQRSIAESQREFAENQRDLAEYETYVALIGVAAAKIEENAFVDARALLTSPVCKPELRSWEWGRLMHLCSQMVRDYEPGAPVESVAFSPDNTRFATAGWNGNATIWDARTGRRQVEIPHDALYVYGVAFSPDGKYLATGCNDRNGFVRIWDATNGAPVSRPLLGHADAVSSVTFSQSGRWLATTSFDSEVRVWDMADPAAPVVRRVLRGHNWWVWDAAFSADDRQLATASQDGTVLVWSLETGTAGPPFTGHRGPVYSVKFLPDGESVVSGGYDKRVLVWRPDSVQPYDFQKLVSGDAPAPPDYAELLGHAAAVRSVDAVRFGEKNLIASGSHDNTIRLWDADSHALLQTMRGHGSWVRDCVLSSDGMLVASGAYDTTNPVKLWSIEGYEEARVLRGRVLQGHLDSVMSASFSPNGKRVVTAARDRTAKVWNAETGEELLTLEEGHSFLASRAVFFQEGQRLLTSAVDNSARVWDVASGVELYALGHTGRAAAAAVSADGARLVTGSDRQSAKVWDAESGELLLELKGHHGEVTAIACSADNQLVFTGDARGRGIVWNLQTGERLREVNWHTAKITAAHFMPDGEWLITASDDKTVTRFNVSERTTDTQLAADESWILEHADSVLSLEMSRSGRLALTASRDGIVRLWDTERARLVRTLPFRKDTVSAAAISPSGLLALTVHDEGRHVRIWNLKTGSEHVTAGPSGEERAFFGDSSVGLVWSATFSEDGDKVLTIGGNEARLWDLRARLPEQQQIMTFSPHGAVADASFSPDGERVVTASWDSSARIWNATTGVAELKLAGAHRGYVNSAVFAPDGSMVLTASDDGTSKLWDARTGEVIRSLEGHTARVHSARFSADGSKIVTASGDKTARVWSTATGAQLQLLAGHEWGVLSAVFSQDGTLVVTGSDDNSARVWDVETGQTIHELSGHTAAVTSVAFSPVGDRILTASADFMAKVWDASTGKEILNLKGHTQELTSVSFSAAGSQALTSSRDGTAILWLTTDWTEPAALDRKGAAPRPPAWPPVAASGKYAVHQLPYSGL